MSEMERDPMNGSCIISEEVIATIACAAATEVKGVAGMAQRPVDLRGLMGDEGWQEVDKYLDEATVAGFTKVRLIHGKGTGALKNAIWQHLKKDKRVKEFRLGQYGEGDGGVTVVELK